MKREWMLQEVIPFLFGYLKEGTICIDSVLQKSPVQIERLHDLLKLRFVKHESTLAFMKSLDQQLTTIKSTTTSRTQQSFMDIKGAIKWEDTLQQRLQMNANDRFHFVTDEAERTFTTDENIVLKQLLKKLYTYTFLDPFVQSFVGRPWLVDVLNHRKAVEKALTRNVYLSKVQDVIATPRMIEKTKAHRKPIYRQAAQLLAFVEQMENDFLTEEQLLDLLHEFFVLPDNEDVLFELYWVVQLLKEQQNVTFHLMDGSASQVASWSDECYDYALYHNSIGSGALHFAIYNDELSGTEHPFTKREFEIVNIYNTLSAEIFHESKAALYWRGRPDILLEQYERGTKQLVAVTIGEIKNTANKSYASQGLKELVQYMQRVKLRNGSYASDTDVAVNGLLCLGEVPVQAQQANHVKIFSLLM